MTVKFITKHTTTAPTLNVNDTGAKPIKDYAGHDLTKAAYEWPEGTAMALTYDGSSWRIQDSNLMERVHTAETGIEQNSKDIKLKANTNDVYNKEDVDGFISKEVTDRNAAIELSATGIQQTVSETYATKTALDDYRKVTIISTATDFDTLVETGDYIIKNGSCTNAPTTNWGKLEVNASGKIVQWFYPDANGKAYYRAKTGSTWSEWVPVDAEEAKRMVQPNLTPFFENHNVDGTYPDGDTNAYWQMTAEKKYSRSGFTALDDGWAHINVTSAAHHEFAPRRVNSLNGGDKVTMLVEWRNVSVTGDGANFYTRNYANNCQISTNWYFGPSMSTESGEVRNVFTVNSTADGLQAWNALVDVTFPCKNGTSSFEGDIRISFYKGDYIGPWKPYSGDLLYATSSRMTAAESTIEQHSEDIIARVTKTEFENLEIGGRNLYTKTKEYTGGN